MMNISSVLCIVYGKNLQSQNFLTRFGRLFHMTGPEKIKLCLKISFCGLGV